MSITYVFQFQIKVIFEFKVVHCLLKANIIAHLESKGIGLFVQFLLLKEGKLAHLCSSL